MESLIDLAGEVISPLILADVHVELRDLVCVHARSGHLDRTRPVEVVVAQVEGQLLDHFLLQGGVVESNVEVGWQDTPLGCELGHQVEIILDVRVIILHDLVVNQAPRRWVLNGSIFTLNKEPLSDSLVDDDNSDVRLLLGEVVGLMDSLSDLSDLLLEDLSSHGITNTISVDNEVIREISMALSKATHCSLKSLLKLLVDYLLASLLTDLLRIVLTQLLVDRSTETDNRSGSRVADVHTNQHGVRQQFLGETEIEQIPTEFGVHLSQDVSSDR